MGVSSYLLFLSSVPGLLGLLKGLWIWVDIGAACRVRVSVRSLVRGSEASV